MRLTSPWSGVDLPPFRSLPDAKWGATDIFEDQQAHDIAYTSTSKAYRTGAALF